MKFERKYYEFIVKINNSLEELKDAIDCGATAILLDSNIDYTDNISLFDDYCLSSDVVLITDESDLHILDDSLSKMEILTSCDSTDDRVVFKLSKDPSYICEYKNLMLDGFVVDYNDNLEEYYNEINKVIFHPEKYDLFVVDFDGTIVDTMPMWRHICADFIVNENIIIEEDINELVRSLTNSEIAALLHRKYLNHLTLDEVMGKLLNFIRIQYLKQNIKPGAVNLLKELRNYGEVILYSATESSLLLDLLNKVGARSLFDGVYSGSDLGLTKADGTGYLEVIKMVKPECNPLILEDAPHAFIGAASQNLDVLVISDFSNKEHLEEVVEHATYFINLNKEV